ncbi:MAG: indole-3-glycerol phosphate synthase TrpC [Anaerolineae bacterium]|nr:indole-3-glycerol phosphate synthase TrpC [Anaerolineae bacterium]MDW8067502.1 indole-3-glycerol phosphate synthase TrpC [Anaerolineae bacterium]
MILERILATKREEVAARRKIVPPEELRARVADQAPPQNFAEALARPGVTLIAEIKRASPSRGPLRPDLDAGHLATLYATHGAGALSVLTDTPFFQGSLPDLARAREALRAGGHAIPILRKDFIIDPYQVYEARAWGADAVLLIAAALPPSALTDLLALAHGLGMHALVEVHNEEELEAVLPLRPPIIGINNRDLRTFRTDITTFARLRPRIPRGTLVVAESGIRTPGDVRYLARAGADAVLVGETLVTAPNIAARVRALASAGRIPSPDIRDSCPFPIIGLP